MKKVFKLIVAIILAIVILGGAMFLVDCSRGKTGKEPMFARFTEVLKDGGTTYYTGLGYQISGFNSFTGGIWAKIGPWTIELQKPTEIEVVPGIIDDENNNIVDATSGDIVNENNVSGDLLISGDNVENVSGDSVSGDSEISDVLSGDESNTEITSGDDVISSWDASNDYESEKNEFVFNAIVIGVNKNNLIVQALEDEAINAYSDIFSFSLNEENNKDGSEFLIGQKVKIEYTGTIAESYPAQIKVVNIEVAES